MAASELFGGTAMRWVRRIGLAALGVVAAVVLLVVGGSELVMRRSHAASLRPVPVPHDAASLAEGGRLAFVFGCRDCHGRQGEGSVMVDDPMFGRLVAPALARVTAGRSDAAIARTLRNGVAHDGTALYVMPVQAYAQMADSDVGRIIGWIRTLRAEPADVVQTNRFGPIGRALVVTGKLPSAYVPDHVMPAARPADLGRYFVSVTCAACHDLHKARPTDDGRQVAPALAQVAAAYDGAAFVRLMRTGRGLGNRDLGLMSTIARSALSHFSDGEIAAMHAYLRAEEAAHPTI